MTTDAEGGLPFAAVEDMPSDVNRLRNMGQLEPAVGRELCARIDRTLAAAAEAAAEQARLADAVREKKMG